MKLKFDKLFESYTKNLNEDLDIDPDDEDVEPGTVVDRLEELMLKKPELKNDLNPILDELKDIIASIINLDSVDGKIDKSDLGAPLYRLSDQAVNIPGPGFN
jgi:hypothetical protein